MAHSRSSPSTWVKPSLALVEAVSRYMLLKVRYKLDNNTFDIEDEGFLGGVNHILNSIIPGFGNGQDSNFRNNTHDGNRPSGRKH